MLFALTDGELWVYGGIICFLLWWVYMATFRTRDFIDLMKADEERKRGQSERLGKAANAGFNIIKWFMK